MAKIRLDRMLSGQGICTRSGVRPLIRSGRITVNGRPAASADEKVDPESDIVALDGQPVSFQEHVYYMMNKPAGVVSASRDPKERTVLDLLPPGMRRPGLFPAGRLDKDTEGMLLITDDGAFAHEILSPRHHVRKRYFVRVDQPVCEQDFLRFSEGIKLPDGTECLPAKLEATADGDGTQLFVTITEGKYHQVKRMFEAVGKKVIYLKRMSIGALQLDKMLKSGETKQLNCSDIENIYKNM